MPRPQSTQSTQSTPNLPQGVLGRLGALGGNPSFSRCSWTSRRPRVAPTVPAYVEWIPPRCRGAAVTARARHRFLHVANGTSTTRIIEAAGIPGACSLWADPLYEGPVPGGLSDTELR